MTSTDLHRTYTTRGNAVICSASFGDDLGFYEISVIRNHRQVGPTFQGTIAYNADRGVWLALAATNSTPLPYGEYATYHAAETALVRRRSGVTAHTPWTGPRPTKPVRPTCRICGWELAGSGECYRTELHWTAESLAADAAAAEARHTARKLAAQNA